MLTETLIRVDVGCFDIINSNRLFPLFVRKLNSCRYKTKETPVNGIKHALFPIPMPYKEMMTTIEYRLLARNKPNIGGKHDHRDDM